MNRRRAAGHDPQRARGAGGGRRRGSRPADPVERSGRPRGSGRKSSPTDVVTQTDLDAESLIRELLAAATPDAGFLGEEGGQRPGRSGAGCNGSSIRSTARSTSSTTFPVVAVSVAAAVDGVVVAGAVVDVLRGETFCAAAGHGATLDGDPIRVSDVPERSITPWSPPGSPTERTSADRQARRRPRVCSLPPATSAASVRPPCSCAGSGPAGSTRTSSATSRSGTTPPRRSSPRRPVP